MSRKEITFMSDSFVEDFVGGAALCDEELISCLRNEHKVDKIKTSEIDLIELLSRKNSFFLISNFFHLHPDLVYFIQENCDYALYAHDYKFVAHTNPNLYENFLVKKEDLINLNLYYNSKGVICQSYFQEKIHKLNLKEGTKTLNISGNFWSEEKLEGFFGLGYARKNGKTAIIDSPYPQKGVKESIKKCDEEGWEYDIISDQDNDKFLDKLSKYSRLVFLPSTPETLCRVVVEAKMMNIEVVTNDLIGASHEEWYIKEGENLVNHMKSFKGAAVSQIRSLIDNG